MARNTGKPSEEEFVDHWQRQGKRAFVYKFEDAAALFGKNKKAVANDAKPCDFIVVTPEETIWSEVKSTEHETRFPFSMIRRGQIGFAKQIVAAGGRYIFFVHSLKLNRWFAIPAGHLLMIRKDGKKSLSWEEMEQFSCAI